MKLRPLRSSRTGPGEGGWGGGFRVEVGCGLNKGLERAETPAWAPSAAGRPDPGGLDSWWDGSPCRISGGERRDELRSLMGHRPTRPRARLSCRHSRSDSRLAGPSGCQGWQGHGPRSRNAPCSRALPEAGGDVTEPS